MKTATYKNYRITKLDNGTINISKNGILANITKPILRELAQEFRIPLYNKNGTEHNTRYLGILIMRAIDALNKTTFNEIDDLLISYTSKYQHGSFYLHIGEDIRQVLIQNNVPNSYGVYIIYSIENNKENIIYIGKSGTMQNNGTFKTQGIAGRLKAVGSNNIPRNIYFQDILEKYNFKKLKFLWIVTVNNSDIEIPALVESKLLQLYFNDNKVLPLLNKSI